MQGELKHLDSQAPVLYIDFSEGRLKLQGAIVYPKNRYMSLRLGGNRSMACEDVFDHLVRSLHVAGCLCLCITRSDLRFVLDQ